MPCCLAARVMSGHRAGAPDIMRTPRHGSYVVRDHIEGDYTVARSAGFREYPLALRVALALNGTSGSDNAEEVPGSR
jgi:hypothetical protein